MRFIDMFAGIGGFHLGMEQAGHTCVGWIEWDKFARQSYQAIHNVEGIWNANDIRTVRANELPRADCWCFGFPCQDISVAGKQRGFTAGKRSSLFFTVTGLIRDLEEEDRPSYLLIENVKNLLSINRGFDFLKLQIELDEIGYDCEWDVLDSAEVVPQHRERVFIVGHLRGRSTREVFPIIDSDGEITKWSDTTNTLTTRYREAQGSGSYVVESEPPKVKQVGNLYGNDDINQLVDSVEKYANVVRGSANPIIRVTNNNDIRGSRQDNRKSGLSELQFTNPNNKSSTVTASHAPKTWDNNLRIRKLTPLECWRLQGFPDWAFNRAKQAGLSDSQLYKQAGNSVTVPVIKMIAERFAVKN